MDSIKNIKPASLASPLYTMEELMSYIDGLHQAMEDLTSLLLLQRKKLSLLRIGLLEDDALTLINEIYGTDRSSLEYKASLDLLREAGAIALIKKVLWSEDLTDWCLSVALDKLIPGFEILVAKYPDVVMEDARTATTRISCLARQTYMQQMDGQK